MNISGTIAKMNDAQQRINTIPNAIDLVVAVNAGTLLDLNRDQMLLGTNTEGKPFTPNYTDDPYFNRFKNPYEAAASYARMKKYLERKHQARITYPLNYHKDALTPNLIVTGTFQDGMYIHPGDGSFTIGSKYDETPNIEAKYGNKVFGLAPLSVDFFWKTFLRKALKAHLKYFGQ